VKLRDELVRAAVWQAFDIRDQGGDLRQACEEIVTVHRCAPLVEYAAELKAARRAVVLADAQVEALRWERAADWLAA